MPAGKATVAALHACEVNVGTSLDALTACGEPARPYVLNGRKPVWCCDLHAAAFGAALEPL